LSSGEILFDQSNIAKMGEKDFFKMQAQSGFVFQDSALWANRTIYDNLSIPLRIMNPYMDKKDIDQRIKSAVDAFNFRENLLIRPSAISAGEKKIISFLRALMTDPDILFFDEPTTSIDKRNISRINSVIMELKQKKKTIITVTHDFRLVRNIADNIILIDKGRIVKSGSFNEIDNSEDVNISRIIKELKGQV
jgi:phospholipid/cholesterol/gamma-HCH transport system ATP-binding protein